MRFQTARQCRNEETGSSSIGECAADGPLGGECCRSWAFSGNRASWDRAGPPKRSGREVGRPLPPPPFGGASKHKLLMLKAFVPAVLRRKAGGARHRNHNKKVSSFRQAR